jgi:uncharacterized 2Fe-2S/4Fe-4S cluster protein (DUF4445 family)
MQIKSQKSKVKSQKYKSIGLALDIGTTVIKACTVDLMTGKVINQAKTYNLQNDFGSDVLMRISNALLGKYSDLRKCLLLSIKEIKDDLQIKNPDFIVVVGNTVTLSFYQNKSVADLAKFPFRSEMRDAKPKIIGKNFIFPVIGSFVGGDTIAGILASRLYKSTKNGLYIDLGTNGEIALITKGKIFATSTAAGPAFEGVGISCGSLAVPGAIDRVKYYRGKFKYHTINEESPNGICASGIIDLLAIMLKHKFIDSSGRLIKNVNVRGFSLNQADIRKLQLAISALHAGIEILLNKSGLNSKDINETVITGEFGANLNVKALKEIGILSSKINNVRFESGLPLKGAIAVLKNRDVIKQVEAIKNASKHIELAVQPDFQKIFVSAMRLAKWNYI